VQPLQKKQSKGFRSGVCDPQTPALQSQKHNYNCSRMPRSRNHPMLVFQAGQDAVIKRSATGVGRLYCALQCEIH